MGSPDAYAQARQAEKVAGNVELTLGQTDVFIEIAPDAAAFPASVLAILAHEITHKVLHRFGISSPPGHSGEQAEEELTDIGTVFLGLGKLMLNGTDTRKVRFEESPLGRTRITQTYKCGYLGLTELAFVYRLVCAMRRIPSDRAERGLSGDALSEVRRCETSFPELFDTAHHETTARTQLADQIQAAVNEVQDVLSEVDRDLLWMQRRCLGAADRWSRSVHKSLARLQRETKQGEIHPEYDPCLNFLAAAELAGATVGLHQTHLQAKGCRDVLGVVTKRVDAAGEPFSEPDSPGMVAVICKNDGAEIIVPQGQTHVRITCPNPKCQYQFIANTSTPLQKSVVARLTLRLLRTFRLSKW